MREKRFFYVCAHVIRSKTSISRFLSRGAIFFWFRLRSTWTFFLTRSSTHPNPTHLRRRRRRRRWRRRQWPTEALTSCLTSATHLFCFSLIRKISFPHFLFFSLRNRPDVGSASASARRRPEAGAHVATTTGYLSFEKKLTHLCHRNKNQFCNDCLPASEISVEKVLASS